MKKKKEHRRKGLPDSQPRKVCAPAPAFPARFPRACARGRVDVATPLQCTRAKQPTSPRGQFTWVVRKRESQWHLHLHVQNGRAGCVRETTCRKRAGGALRVVRVFQEGRGVCGIGVCVARSSVHQQVKRKNHDAKDSFHEMGPRTKSLPVFPAFRRLCQGMHARTCACRTHVGHAD